MIYNTIRILSKHKQLVILSTAIVALGLYIVPVDHLFTAPSVQAQAQGGKYGENRFGPPPGQGGQNPGAGGGSPPGNTPGGSSTPPGQQKNNPGHGPVLATQSNGDINTVGGGQASATQKVNGGGGGGSDHTTGGGGGGQGSASQQGNRGH